MAAMQIVAGTHAAVSSRSEDPAANGQWWAASLWYVRSLWWRGAVGGDGEIWKQWLVVRPALVRVGLLPQVDGVVARMRARLEAGFAACSNPIDGAAMTWQTRLCPMISRSPPAPLQCTIRTPDVGSSGCSEKNGVEAVEDRKGEGGRYGADNTNKNK